MSDRDRSLLDAAGISIADAATMLNRSRQALYSGLSKKDRDYFSAGDVLLLIHAAKRQSSPQLEQLLIFVEQNYSPRRTTASDDRELILQTRVGLTQVYRALKDAKQVFVWANDNSEHLRSPALFAVVLMNLGRFHSQPKFVVPTKWIQNFIADLLRLQIPAKRVVEIPELSAVPLLLILKEDKPVRVFIFGRIWVEEATASDAEKIWANLNSLVGTKTFNPAFLLAEDPDIRISG
jgi:hypothetical protein